MTIRPISECPNPLDGIYNPPDALKHGAGYRVMPPVPAVQAGYTRVSIVPVDVDGIHGAWQVQDRLTVDMQAEWDAAEATRKATPQVLDYPLEMPSLILQTLDGAKGAELFVSDSLQLAVIEAHASPLKSKAQRVALAKADFAKRADLNAKGKAGVSGQLQARIENIERFLGWRI